MLSVGELLKKEREKKGLTLSQVEKEIRVRQKLLDAIEKQNWKLFSSKIYISGIIKNYARYLGLDYKKLLAFFRREYEQLDDVNFKKSRIPLHITTETKRIALLILVAISVLFIVYFGYQLKQYLSPPFLAIISPKVNSIVKENKIKIVGKTEKEAVITVLGEQIFPDKKGIFTFEFPLKMGGNQLTIEAVGGNGKKTILKVGYIRKK